MPQTNKILDVIQQTKDVDVFGVKTWSDEKIKEFLTNNDGKTRCSLRWGMVKRVAKERNLQLKIKESLFDFI